MYHHPKFADRDMCIANLSDHYNTPLCYMMSTSSSVISQILRVDISKLPIAIVLRTTDCDKGVDTEPPIAIDPTDDWLQWGYGLDIFINCCLTLYCVCLIGSMNIDHITSVMLRVAFVGFRIIVIVINNVACGASIWALWILKRASLIYCIVRDLWKVVIAISGDVAYGDR